MSLPFTTFTIFLLESNQIVVKIAKSEIKQEIL